MKLQSPNFTRLKLKILFSIFCISTIIAFTECKAQSIVGKWKGISVKKIYSPEYAKQTGKSTEEQFAKDIGNSFIEYKPDHTFIMSFSLVNSSEVTTMNGNWSLTGDELKYTLEPQYNPQKKTTTATVLITGNSMVTTAIISPPSRIIKTISIGTRM